MPSITSWMGLEPRRRDGAMNTFDALQQTNHGPTEGG
jgi:hypothetical protein